MCSFHAKPADIVRRDRQASKWSRIGDKKLGPVLVSGNRLAVHFGVVRQHVDQLAAQGVIERRPDGLFDQDQSRLKYFTYLRSEHRRSPRTVADTAHIEAKTAMLQLKLAEKRRACFAI
jgi:hypothetical protein